MADLKRFRVRVEGKISGVEDSGAGGREYSRRILKSLKESPKISIKAKGLQINAGPKILGLISMIDKYDVCIVVIYSCHQLYLRDKYTRTLFSFHKKEMISKHQCTSQLLK